MEQQWNRIGFDSQCLPSNTKALQISQLWHKPKYLTNRKKPSPYLILGQPVWIVETPIVLASNNTVIKLLKFDKCNSNFEKAILHCTKQWALSTVWRVQKKQLPIASPHHFRANPKGNPQIKILQIETFATSSNLECQLRFKIYHHPWSYLCIFHYSSVLDDSHPRDSTKQRYKRLVVTYKNV